MDMIRLLAVLLFTLTIGWGGFNGADVLGYYEVQAGLLFIYKQNMHGTLTSYLSHI
jgi:hypothetical protein